MTPQEITHAICKSLKLPKLDAAARMGGVRGWDSLRHVRLMLDLEKAFQVKIPVEEFGELTSVESIVSYLTASAGLKAE